MDNYKDWLCNLLKTESIPPEDIPNIGLYMDQVTTLMDTRLASSKRYPDDKILTKTMINNYTKNKLLPPSNKKKYSREHIFLLIMMNLTSVCAVNETPRYKIIGSSYQQEDIDEMYKVKDQLLLNYNILH